MASDKPKKNKKKKKVFKRNVAYLAETFFNPNFASVKNTIERALDDLRESDVDMKKIMIITAGDDLDFADLGFRRHWESTPELIAALDKVKSNLMDDLGDTDVDE